MPRPTAFHGPDAVQVSRFETFARKLLGMKGSGLVRGISPELQISIDPMQYPEQRYLSGVRNFAQGRAFAASAANLNFSQIWNAPGSSTLVVVEFSHIQMAAADPLQFLLVIRNRSLATLANYVANAINPRDGRLPNVPAISSGMATLFETAQAPAGPAGAVAFTLFNGGITHSGFQYSFPVVLPPGWGVGWSQQTVNTTGCHNYVGYERAMENSELTGAA